MDSIKLILENTSLWEVTVLLCVLYFLAQPNLVSKIINRVTQIKIGELIIELEKVKEQAAKTEEQVARTKEQILELEAEIENERHFVGNLIDDFDPNAPMSELAGIKATIKSVARNLDNLDDLARKLDINSDPRELYAVAVTLRVRRPPALIPAMIDFLQKVAESDDLLGYRLNTIWTLTSALHLTLLSAIRDRIPPHPDRNVLLRAKETLEKLERNPKVQGDSPDKPMKGIRGPIKHCQRWIEKGLLAFNGL